jgi:hypothetical protein
VGSATLSAAGSRTVRVGLSVAARAVLRRASSLHITFTLSASASGVSTTTRAAVTLRR